MMTQSSQSKPALEPLVPLGGRSPWSILPALLLGFFMIMVDTTIVNVATPTLIEEFDASIIAVGWVSSGYMLMYASLLLVAGRLGDRYGFRRIFTIGLIVFTLASAWCGFSGDIFNLIAARVVQGIGAALIAPQSMAMITRVFPPTKRGAAMGLWGSVAGVATITGPVLGGILLQTWGWQWIFFVNVPVGVVAIWMSRTRLPKLERSAKSMDGVGAMLSLVGLFLLVFGVQEGETFHWGQIIGPIYVWMVIAAGLMVLGAFLLWQRHLGERALMPLSLFAYRNFSLANVAGMSVSFLMVGMNFPLMIFLQMALGLDPLHAALVSLPSSLVSGVSAPVMGRLSDRIPGKWLVSFGFSLLAAATFVLAWLVSNDAKIWTIIVVLLVFGLGSSAVFSPLANVATSGLGPKTAGAGSGIFNTTRQIGGVVGAAVIVAVLTSRLATAIPQAAERLAQGLPKELRQPFIDSFSQLPAQGTSPFSAGHDPTVFQAVPGQYRQVVETAAHQAYLDGFSAAVGQSILVTACVAAIGLLAALAMNRGAQPSHPVQ